MVKCPICHGTGKVHTPSAWRPRTVLRFTPDVMGCRFCNMLGYIDDQIKVTYALDKELAHEMAKERREGDKSIRQII